MIGQARFTQLKVDPTGGLVQMAETTKKTAVDSLDDDARTGDDLEVPKRQKDDGGV